MLPERSYKVLFSITKKAWAPCFSLELPGYNILFNLKFGITWPVIIHFSIIKLLRPSVQISDQILWRQRASPL